MREALTLEFHWCEIAQLGMQSLGHILNFQPVSNLPIGILKTIVVTIIDVFRLDGDMTLPSSAKLF